MNTVSPRAPHGKPHYVYILTYPDDFPDPRVVGITFYVGKGKGNRIHAHELEAKGVRPTNNPYKCAVIQKIWRQGCQVVKEKVAFFATHEEAILYEIATIVLMRGYGHLTNFTDGGEGLNGTIRSLETRHKIAEKARREALSEETLRKRSEAAKGKTQSIETLQKLSQIRKGRTPHNKGKPMSEASKQKLSKAKMGHPGTPLSEEHRRKLIESNKGRAGRPLSEEHRRKLSDTLKGRPRQLPSQPRSEETRRKLSEANRGKTLTEEHRQKISLARKGQRPSEETRQKLSEVHKASQRSQEHIHELSESNKGQKLSEEHRHKIGETLKQHHAKKRA